ncbi:transmembrane protein 106A isoform X2 [Crotalus tigris]|uniref:transmembrane protein 106A isoform X2 n=1 Tax=Crotalus tigris TaxID=88082 RepID=UPI00192F2246|nr:transmembrane protein 106A isoform X2 [Crotalus tigris]
MYLNRTAEKEGKWRLRVELLISHLLQEGGSRVKGRRLAPLYIVYFLFHICDWLRSPNDLGACLWPWWDTSHSVYVQWIKPSCGSRTCLLQRRQKKANRLCRKIHMLRMKHPVMPALIEQMLLRCLVFLVVTTPVELLSLVLLAKALEESPEEQQLVALIPYGDQRLKPRRTKLYVFLTVAISLLTTCLMMYFLFPRSVAVLPSGLNASTISFDNSTSSIILNMTNILNVTNSNFYPVYVAQLDIEVLHKTVVIGKKTVMTQLDIRPLQSAQILYSVSSTIMDTNTYKICTWIKIKVHNVLLHIQATLL